MNPFQNNYPSRLESWRKLREYTATLSTEQACVEIDRWWQQAPLVTHHLHWNDSAHWPDPWILLHENIHCPLTRALGSCYTVLMSTKAQSAELVHARDSESHEHYLVFVDNAKYVLNWWPNCVINTSQSEFTILSSKSLESIKNKIR